MATKKPAKKGPKKKKPERKGHSTFYVLDGTTKVETVTYATANELAAYREGFAAGGGLSTSTEHDTLAAAKAHAKANKVYVEEGPHGEEEVDPETIPDPDPPPGTVEEADYADY